MWNPFAKKYYRRTHPDVCGQHCVSAGVISATDWTHELLEVRWFFTTQLYRAVVMSSSGQVRRYNTVAALGQPVDVPRIWNPSNGILEPVSKDHFEMMWNLYGP